MPRFARTITVGGVSPACMEKAPRGPAVLSHATFEYVSVLGCINLSYLKNDHQLFNENIRCLFRNKNKLTKHPGDCTVHSRTVSPSAWRRVMDSRIDAHLIGIRAGESTLHSLRSELVRIRGTGQRENHVISNAAGADRRPRNSVPEGGR